MKVWAVEVGEYSDYSVDKLFLKEEDARRYYDAKDPTSWGLHEPQEWEVVEDLGGEPVTHIVIHGWVSENEDGYLNENVNVYFPFEREVLKPCVVGDVTHDTYTQPKGSKGTIRFTVEGTDVERCRKVASERKAQFKAEFDVWVERLTRNV